MVRHLLSELEAFGLSDKAARVYLASLEIGPSPVQRIAEKADVNRPTAYVMIETLTGLGLMNVHEKGKKRLFHAEQPDRLLHILKEQREEVEKKQSRINAVITDLNELGRASASKPIVRYYEGMEGVHTLREEVLAAQKKELLEILPLDTVRRFVPENGEKEEKRAAIRENHKIRSIYNSNEGAVLPKKKGATETKWISEDELPLESEIIVFDEKTVFFTFEGKQLGFLIEDRAVANTMRAIFNKIWGEKK